jgi:hypothetical protein
VKRARQIVTNALDRDAALLHRLQQRRLCFRRCAVDLVGQDDVGENWSRNKLQRSPASRAIFFDDFRAGDVGRHQVGRELDPLKREIENIGDGPYQQRLGETRHAGDDRVAADEERQQDLFDHFVLADNRLPYLAQQALARGSEFVEQLLVADG